MTHSVLSKVVSIGVSLTLCMSGFPTTALAEEDGQDANVTIGSVEEDAPVDGVTDPVPTTEDTTASDPATLSDEMPASVPEPADDEQVVMYDLWLGGVQVTDQNAADIFGDDDEGARARFDAASATLTLEGATINAADDSACIRTTLPQLTISGSATVKGAQGIAAKDCALTLEAAGDGIVVEATDVAIAADALSVRGKVVASVTTGTAAITATTDITLADGLHITTPASGYVQGGTICQSNGTAAQVVVIEQQDSTVQLTVASAKKVVPIPSIPSQFNYTGDVVVPYSQTPEGMYWSSLKDYMYRPGDYQITATLSSTSTYEWSDGTTAPKVFKYTIVAPESPMEVSTRTIEYLVSDAKVRAQTCYPIYVTNDQGHLSYAKVSGSGNLSIDPSSGTVTLKKGSKKGTYKACIAVTDSESPIYKDKTVEVTIVVKVVKKLSNSLAVTAGSKTVKASKVKKKKVTVGRPCSVKYAIGSVSYKKVGGSKKLSVNTRNGKVTVAKGTKKGTYKIKIKVTAAGNYSHAKASKTVTCTIVVR